ncbi:MAG: hypothetical protein OEY94_00005, partial [Alphaproteobacteria bacterium]|nr:hypothetical protein [Alphaproteobacteria bacterium]
MIKKFLILLVVLFLTGNPALADSDYSESDKSYMKAPVAQNEYETKVLDILKDIIENQFYLNVPEQDARMY